ncbi:MAG: FAD-dependent oxidoreductase [Deltaproteobacteria bacterium]|jgi:adenylylsulfate reductase subunit A|nr:FAD-dependent oxidoreductase [Deltaproteobacteria bacterium]
MVIETEYKTKSCDVLVIGGGAAGCAAARALSGGDEKVILVEKATIGRSGCLAAGVNAINAWLAPGREPREYADYAMADAHGIASRELLLSMSERLNEAVEFLESLGVRILKDGNGAYVSRSWRNLKIGGENIKPLLAASLKDRKNLEILERTQAVSYLLNGDDPPGIAGAAALKVGEPVVYLIGAGAVICATGGVAGVYAPNNKGKSSHKTWYCPFDTGAGHGMGILAGAEFTTLEMRFVALRTEDCCAPTGTLALGAGARQVNAFGEEYEARYGNTTSRRVLAARTETLEGRGPVRLATPDLSPGERKSLARAYFNMAPLQALKWLEEENAVRGEAGGEAGREAERDGETETRKEIRPLSAFVEGTEPYVTGGHAAGGYRVNVKRETTIPGLFACGDVAGGAPQKYVSGAIAEGRIAAEGALEHLEKTKSRDRVPEEAFEGPAVPELKALLKTFAENGDPGYSTEDLEEAMQKAMDELAGGKSRNYVYNSKGLALAGERIRDLFRLSGKLKASAPRDLNRIWELRERLITAASLVAHLRARKETRWPGFGTHGEHPGPKKEFELFVCSRLKKPRPVPPAEGDWGEIEILMRDLATEEILSAPDEAGDRSGEAES